MNTTHTPESRLNTFLDMYTNPANTAGEIAAAMGISIVELISFAALPQTTQALQALDAFNKARTTFTASFTFQRVIRQLEPIATLPTSPTPKDLDRARHALDSTRRAADSLLKLHATPKPPAQPRPSTSLLSAAGSTTPRAA
jgi:hypothetical protein